MSQQYIPSLNPTANVEVVHALVPGRARLRVRGVYRNDAGCRHLTAALEECADIHLASVNALTGTVLIHFAPERTLHQLLSELERLFDSLGRAGAIQEPVSLRRMAAIPPPARRGRPWNTCRPRSNGSGGI